MNGLKTIYMNASNMSPDIDIDIDIDFIYSDRLTYTYKVIGT